VTDRELLEMIASQVSKLTNEVVGIKEKINIIDEEINSINKTVTHIENDHGKKLQALFDGYKQNSDKLDRIETVVSRHDEFIIKRVK
jgi:archaellum component FlaC